jgi:hypothetical protein
MPATAIAFDRYGLLQNDVCAARVRAAKKRLVRGKVIDQIKFPQRDADPARVALKRMLAVSRLKETTGNFRQPIGLN